MMVMLRRLSETARMLADGRETAVIHPGFRTCMWRPCLTTGIWLRWERHGQRAVHQDVVARRRHPPYAGDCRGTAAPFRRPFRLGGRGGVHAAGAAASGGRRGPRGR